MRSHDIAALLLVLLLPTGAAAQTPTCDALQGDARAVAVSVLAAQHPYDCCDDTIARCLDATPRCPLAARLADAVCRLAGAGKDAPTIARALERRALTMMRPGRVHPIDTSSAPRVGPAGAPVELAVYLCLRCPYCSKLLPALHREVTAGRLAGKVALTVRLFPIKGHLGSTEANLAAQAANAQGRFWDYLLYAYGHFGEFTPDGLPAWATAVGLDRAAYDAALADPRTRAALVASKKEGLANGVEGTPTLFINGRLVVADMDLETLVDLCEEELEAR